MDRPSATPRALPAFASLGEGGLFCEARGEVQPKKKVLETRLATEKVPIRRNAQPQHECIVLLERLLNVIDCGAILAQSGMDERREDSRHRVRVTAPFQPVEHGLRPITLPCEPVCHPQVSQRKRICELGSRLLQRSNGVVESTLGPGRCPEHVKRLGSVFIQLER
jgi:hypothetical protein